MVTAVMMRVWIRLVQGSEKVKDQDEDEAHGKSEGVYFDRSDSNAKNQLQDQIQLQLTSNRITKPIKHLPVKVDINLLLVVVVVVVV